ncbi:MAG TPA: hypothetical protein VNW92_24530 [Polyangiaceae bacterium]|nr:hypothetical protein [Polyangiaceae bacterium]
MSNPKSAPRELDPDDRKTPLPRPPIEDPPLPPIGPTPGEPDSEPSPDSVPESPEPTPIDG